jgi:hypothetical protein
MPRGDYEVWVSVGGGEWAAVTPLRVREFTPPEQAMQPVDANFNNWITLLGYELERDTLSPGEPLVLRLHWQSQQPTPVDYTMFVHLLDAAGNTVAQADVVPGDGAWPTSGWSPGEWVMTAVSLNPPADLPPGRYDILVGWYYWETGERLPVIGNTSGENAVIIPGITVP